MDYIFEKIEFHMINHMKL